MRSVRRTLAAVAAIGFLVCAAYAADEQWLQYRWTDRPAEYGVTSMGVELEISDKAPEGLALPAGIGASPAFVRWETPMAKSGFVPLVVSKSAAEGDYDQLFIDANANGSLADEQVTKPARVDQAGAQFSCVKVVFPSGDGPIAYHLSMEIYSYAGRRMLAIAGNCWYEGRVKIGGKEYECALIDYDCNGTFDDVSMDQGRCDMIRIGGKQTEPKHAGKYAQVDDKLYLMRIARDGAFVTFEDAGAVPMGTLAVSDKVNLLSVVGENGQFDSAVRDGKAAVPAGKWIVNTYRINAQDARGAGWELLGGPLPPESAFEVSEGGETALGIGEPVTATAQATYRSGAYVFGEKLQGKLGEAIRLTLQGGLPPAPKLRIRNADGSYDRTFAFQYG